MKKSTKLKKQILGIFLSSVILFSSFPFCNAEAAEVAFAISAADVAYSLFTYYDIYDLGIKGSDLLFGSGFSFDPSQITNVALSMEELWPEIYQAGMDQSSTIAMYLLQCSQEFGEVSEVSSSLWSSVCNALNAYSAPLVNGAVAWFDFNAQEYSKLGHSITEWFNNLGRSGLSADSQPNAFDFLTNPLYPGNSVATIYRNGQLRGYLKGNDLCVLYVGNPGTLSCDYYSRSSDMNVTFLDFGGATPTYNSFKSLAFSWSYTICNPSYKVQGTWELENAWNQYFANPNYNSDFIGNSNGNTSNENKIVVPDPPTYTPSGQPSEVPQVVPSWVQTTIEKIRDNPEEAPDALKEYREKYIQPLPSPTVAPDPDQGELPSPGNPTQPDAPSVDDPTGEGDSGSDAEANNQYLASGITDKFPFCIPWDIAEAFTKFTANRKAPKFDFVFKSDRFGINVNIPVDLSSFDPVASIFRLLELIFFVIGLMIGTRRLLMA